MFEKTGLLHGSENYGTFLTVIRTDLIGPSKAGRETSDQQHTDAEHRRKCGGLTCVRGTGNIYLVSFNKHVHIKLCGLTKCKEFETSGATPYKDTDGCNDTRDRHVDKNRPACGRLIGPGSANKSRSNGYSSHTRRIVIYISSQKEDPICLEDRKNKLICSIV